MVLCRIWNLLTSKFQIAGKTTDITWTHMLASTPQTYKQLNLVCGNTHVNNMFWVSKTFSNFHNLFPNCGNVNTMVGTFMLVSTISNLHTSKFSSVETNLSTSTKSVFEIGNYMLLNSKVNRPANENQSCWQGSCCTLALAACTPPYTTCPVESPPSQRSTSSPWSSVHRTPPVGKEIRFQTCFLCLKTKA